MRHISMQQKASCSVNKQTSAGPGSAISRTGTPTIPTEAAPPESVAADEALVAQLAIAITDIKAMEGQMWKLWREELSMMLPDTSAVSDGESESLEGLCHVEISVFHELDPDYGF